MGEKKKIQGKVVDPGRAETEIYVPSEEVRDDFNEAARAGSTGYQEVKKKVQERPSDWAELSGGDIDADVRSDGSEETAAGNNPTPDQNDVEALGTAMGLSYEANEPLHTTEKIAARDKARWELDPASAEDYEERTIHQQDPGQVRKSSFHQGDKT